MRALVLLLFFLAQPFWETTEPEKWTQAQIQQMLTDSPWAQSVGPVPALMVYLATAKPVELAQSEADRRFARPAATEDPEYADFVSQHRAEVFVLAIPYASLAGLGDAKETHDLEEETVMRIGKRAFKIAGYFPPTPSDPVLRLVFPREVQPSDKTVDFRLYLPGIPFPEREAEFTVKSLVYRGKLEM